MRSTDPKTHCCQWYVRGSAWRGAMVLLAWVAAVGWPWATAAGQGSPAKYGVEGLLLVKFTTYIKWPDSAFAGADAPVAIGVLGDDPFGDVLERVALGIEVGKEKRKIVIRRSKKPDDLKACQVVFISPVEKNQMPQALSQTSCLMVGETAGFLGKGGIINFYLNGSKVRFEINNDNAVSHGLTISPELLALAKPAP